jgi:hypothetical protein
MLVGGSLRDAEGKGAVRGRGQSGARQAADNARDARTRVFEMKMKSALSAVSDRRFRMT